MVEKIESSTKIAISIYEEIEKFVRRDEYSDALRKELESSIRKYRTLFSKWRKDLEQTDHGIVVAGKKIMCAIYMITRKQQSEHI